MDNKIIAILIISTLVATSMIMTVSNRTTAKENTRYIIDSPYEYYLAEGMKRNVYWLYSWHKDEKIWHLSDERPSGGTNNNNIANLDSSYNSPNSAMIFDFPWKHENTEYPLDSLKASYEPGVTPYVNLTVNTNYVPGKTINFEVRFDANGDGIYETKALFTPFTTQWNQSQNDGEHREEKIRAQFTGYSNGAPGNMVNGKIQMAFWRTDGITDNPGTAVNEDWMTIYCGAFYPSKESWVVLPYKWPTMNPVAVIGPDDDQDPLDWWLEPPADPNSPHYFGYVTNYSIVMSASDSYSPVGAELTSYMWDFGDGHTGTGEIAKCTNHNFCHQMGHRYYYPGVYWIQLWVTDDNGRVGWVDHWIKVFQTSPVDTEIPVLNEDNSDSEGSAGDIFNFNISAHDNIKVASVNVEWRHGDSSANESLSKEGKYWTGSVTLENSLEELIYVIYVKDTSNNTNISSEITVDVFDNAPPELVQDRAGNSGSTGDNYTFEAIITDNFGVDMVSVKYTYDYNNYTTISLVHVNNDIWASDIIISESASILAYSYLLRDLHGNELDTSISEGEITVDILDTIEPTAVSGKDRTVEQYQIVLLDGSNSTDNIGIMGYRWKFTYNGDEELIMGLKTEFRFEIAGNYNISLKVTDMAGNWDTDYFILTVKDAILPIANIDSIRNQNEGSSITFKGGMSSDNVGIVNYTWTFVYRGMTVHLYNETTFYTFLFPGEYNVTLTVTDGYGNKNSDHMKFKILDKTEPEVNISISGNYVQDGDKIEITMGKKVIMDSSNSFDNVEITNRTWTIKSKYGTVELFTETAEYVFAKAGVYTITLSIHDAADNTGEIIFKIIVSEPSISSSVEGTEGSLSSTWVYIIVTIVIVLVIVILIGIILKKRKHSDDDIEETYHEDRVSMTDDHVHEKYPMEYRQFSPQP